MIIIIKEETNKMLGVEEKNNDGRNCHSSKPHGETKKKTVGKNVYQILAQQLQKL